MTNREIALGSADGFVYVYDVVAGKLRRDYVGSSVCSFWLGEGCVLVQSQDGKLRLLDSGKISYVYVFKINNTYKLHYLIVRDKSISISQKSIVPTEFITWGKALITEMSLNSF